MINYENSVVNQFVSSTTGTASTQTPVTVRFSSSGAKAALFSDNTGTSIDNPVMTDNTGNYNFFIDDGTYDIIINEGQPSERALRKQQLIDLTRSALPSVINYYVSNLGNDTSNGTTPATPFATIQKAIDVIFERGDIFPSTYTINLAAGTYDRGRFNDGGMNIEGFITIKGPNVGGHPNVPTAIISEGASVIGFGILCSQNTKVRCEDIKFIGWTGSPASTGFRGNAYCQIFTNNCHFDGCNAGIGGYENSIIDVKGGIFENCANATIGLFNTKFQVGTQNAGTLDLGPIIRNCDLAARHQEGGVGHFDYVTVEDCDAGVRMLVNSRLNLSGTSFERITNSAVYITQGCYGDTSNTVFGVGANSNGANYSVGHSSSMSAEGIQGVNTANSAAEYTFATSYPKTVVNSTVAQVLQSYVINQSALNDAQFTGIASNKIGVRVTGTLAGTTSFKRINLRVGSSPQTISFTSISTGIGFVVDLWVDFIGENEQYLAAVGSSDQESETSSLFITESTSSNLTVQVEAVVGDASDSITINSIEWYQRGF